MTAMQVQSTAIADIDYTPEHGKLFVTFNDGDEYVYVGVPVQGAVLPAGDPGSVSVQSGLTPHPAFPAKAGTQISWRSG
jgi:hypothetical protein